MGQTPLREEWGFVFLQIDSFCSSPVCGTRLAILGYSCAVFCIAPTDDTDFRIVMELADKWVGLFRRHNDANPNSSADAVLGASFAGGTTDEPRMFDFTQGETSLNLFWKTDCGILSVPTQEQVDCHAPKAILLYLADITWPYAWDLLGESIFFTTASDGTPRREEWWFRLMWRPLGSLLSLGVPELTKFNGCLPLFGAAAGM